MDLPTVLQNAQHPNLEIRNQAETFLNQAVDAQYGPFLLALTVEFATEGKPDHIRQLAGLYIKNIIAANDENILKRKVEQWLQCDATTKEQIRAGFLEAVKSTSRVVSHTSAQILAAYGSVDVPRNAWPALLATLFSYISSPDMHDECKRSSLEALGYMCEVMSPENVDATIVNQILSSIIDGMRAERAIPIRLAAVIALNNSLDFTAANFENQVERDAILRSICEATQATDVQIRSHSFECFATIADLYYEKLHAYIETIFQLSLNALKGDDPLVGMQVLELWNTVSDAELSIKADIEDGEAEASSFLNLTGTAAPTLVPLLLECMTKQEEDDDGGENWTIATAASTLLEGIARTIEDNIVDMVLPFVTQNINNANWHLKEAALMAFGSILDGPSSDKLSPLVMQAMPILINCLKDTHTLVRNTSAYTIGRICELHKDAMTNDVYPAMMSGLASALDDPAPKVCSMALYAVHSLAEACSEESESASNILSTFMPQMLEKLLQVTAREDADAENLITSSYEAVNSLVTNCALDMQPILMQLLNEAMNRLGAANDNTQLPANERMRLQSCLCSLIGEIVKKIDTDQVHAMNDRIMTLLFKVFDSKGTEAHEDAFMAIGIMAEKNGAQFIRYVPYLQPPLLAGLKSIEEHQLCSVAVGVVGDLCRALNNSILPFCDDIMRCLLELLQSQVLNRSVKPLVISLFSDVAMAIEGDFERYAQLIMGILKQAGEVNISSDQEELVEYINTLRNSILEAYTGILLGLGAAHKTEVISPFFDGVVEFIHRSSMDPNHSEEVLKSALGLLGDLCKSLPMKMKPVCAMPFMLELVNAGLQSDESTRETAEWLKSIVTLLLKA